MTYVPTTLTDAGFDRQVGVLHMVMLVALLVVADMFIGVCYHAYGTDAEIHTGRKTWASLG